MAGGFPVGASVPGSTFTEELPPTAPTVNAAGQPQYVGQQPPGISPVQIQPPSPSAPPVPLVQPSGYPQMNFGRSNFQGDVSQPAPVGQPGGQVSGQPVGQPTAAAPRAAVPISAPPGQVESIKGTVEVINKHWDAVSKAASSATQDIGTLNTVKSHVPGAITGVEANKRAYVNGIAALLGVTSAKLAQENTDLLVKSANMGATKASSDAMALLIESTRPNVHMNKEAILKAADIVIAQRRLDLEKQRVLQPVKDLIDRGSVPPATYNAEKVKLDSIDPRVLQLSAMTAAEKKALMGSMTDSEQVEFIKGARLAHQLGMTP